MRSSSFAPCIVGLLFFLLAAGCVRGESAPPREPPVTGATQGGAIGVEPSVAKTESQSVKAPAKIPASPSTAEQPQAGVLLAELRERYNLLLLKVLSLLQGNDPALAQDVAASREAIWGILADPVKFATL